ncbi:MAG: hypothetical protein H6662_17220 [Ardenticatenaceae bacterium]|nr:hypothetical protein [Anaerolineales bacterium]MCB8923331.1 hypothetical protein [Ardenticatenaceae bacterium]MCB9004669.1 hypothetical protein [Ardenticatenaceae bacterium]
MTTIGSASVGLVWGWWVVMVEHGWKRPLHAFPLLILPTLLLPLLLWWFYDWVTAVTFLVAAFISLSTHLAWLKQIKDRARGQR